MKKVFKVLIILMVISFIVPQIALASWWNPFSWKFWDMFRRPQTTTVNTNQTSQDSDVNIRIEKEKEEAEAAKIKAEMDRLQKEKEVQARIQVQAQTQAEAVRLLKEKEAQAEVDKIQKEKEAQIAVAEQQRIEQQRIETARIAAEQNALIKIEKCKAETQIIINNFLGAGKLAINEAEEACMSDRMKTIWEFLPVGVSPTVVSSAINLARSSCQKLTNENLNKLQSQTDGVYSQQYLNCLNK